MNMVIFEKPAECKKKEEGLLSPAFCLNGSLDTSFSFDLANKYLRLSIYIYHIVFFYIDKCKMN